MAKKRSEAEQREVYDMWCQSGLTQREFSRQNNDPLPAIFLAHCCLAKDNSQKQYCFIR